ncbi:MAG: DUF1566 domain-containing protein [Epsilonproteobacteria bacterium]|nr:DUF1566 domain-containing protein [Campylobacterota bacterium]
MKKNLITTNQSAKLALSKSKSLLDITNKILTTKKPTPPTQVGRISDDQTRAIEFEDQIEAWIDKETGLMWEVKTKENIEHMYVWSEERIEEAFFPENLTDSVKDAFSYAKKLNEMNYAGFNDWRVPTTDELETLLTEKNNSDRHIKVPLSKNSSEVYWSSTTSEIGMYDAWYVFFGDDYIVDIYEYGCNYIRCVRAGQ